MMGKRELKKIRDQIKAQIKLDLLKQLEINKTIGNQYTDLVEDYMELWDIKNMLIDDIKKRGVTVKYSNGGGQEGTKKNESISELTRTNAQMLKILSELGLKATEIKVPEDDDESL